MHPRTGGGGLAGRMQEGAQWSDTIRTQLVPGRHRQRLDAAALPKVRHSRAQVCQTIPNARLHRARLVVEAALAAARVESFVGAGCVLRLVVLFAFGRNRATQ